jgi:hypothetical protein
MVNWGFVFRSLVSVNCGKTATGARMYGMINRAIEELVITARGEKAWEAVKASAGVEVDIFISNDAYPDEMTVSLAAAATEHLGLSSPEFMRQFGIHWVVITATRDYEDLLLAGGTSLREFLCNLPNLHERVSLLLPHLDPPTFRCSDLAEHSLRLHYQSRRIGLTHFVEGLLLGLGIHFQIPVKVSLVAEKQAGADHDEFLIEW